MNIGRLTNGNTGQQNATNENAMYNTPPLVGLSPHLAGQNITYRLKTDLNDTLSKRPTSGVEIVTEYSLEESEFYQSYDPKVGLHTAAVLGGILVLLILFLLYKTKCKQAVKTLIKQIRQKHKRVIQQEESMGTAFIPSVNEQTCCSTEQFPIKSESFVCDEPVCQSNDCCPGNSQCVSSVDVVDASCGPNEMTLTDIPTFNISGPSPSSSPMEEESCQTLPNLETDIAKATALWVQDMPLSSQSVNDISGVILQVQSNMTKNHLPGSCPIETMLSRKTLSPVPLAYTWNTSLPILSTSITISCERKQLELDNNIQFNDNTREKNPQQLTIAIPDATETSSSAKLHVHSPVPFPVTPTVTIQNFTSKGNSQHSSLQRDSNDSMTSNSSEDLLLVPSCSTQSWKCKRSRKTGWTGTSESCELFSDGSKSSLKPRVANTETKF